MRKKVNLYYYSLILILCSSLSFAFVMGTDDKVVLTEEESSCPAFKQIGQIMLSEGGFVSGLLMGKNCDVVISVGHASYY